MTAKTLKKASIAVAAAAALAGGTLAAAPMAHAEIPSTDLGGTHETPHFHVTAKAVERVDNLTLADVEVCAKRPQGGTVSVSWEPWALVDVQGKEVGAGRHEGGTTKADYPYGDGTPPNDELGTVRHLSDGQCATGKVSFADDQSVQTKQIVYRNSYDEALVWNLDS